MDIIKIEADLEDYALAERRELQTVWLLREVSRLGRHAFYNCRNLKTLYFWDTLRDIGDGAFKNCERLSELGIVQSGEGSHAALKSILSELSGAFLISFMTEEPSETAAPVFRNRIYLPSYLHDYEENTEARIINQVTYGAGVHYRECIREAGIDYAAYDKLFSRCIPLDREAAWKVAFFRCAYPWELRSAARKKYLDWLREHREQVVEGLCREGEDMPSLLQLWLSLEPYQTEEDWKEALDHLHECGSWTALALLLCGLQEWRGRLETGKREESEAKRTKIDRRRTNKFEF